MGLESRGCGAASRGHSLPTQMKAQWERETHTEREEGGGYLRTLGRQVAAPRTPWSESHTVDPANRSVHSSVRDNTTR